MGYYSPFRAPEEISIVVEPQGAFGVGHQHSLFWGPGVISTINDPRGAFTCRSSILVVLANSGPFRGQLLTVLGPRNDFHD